jgi:hypothetical protein
MNSGAPLMSALKSTVVSVIMQKNEIALGTEFGTIRDHPLHNRWTAVKQKRRKKNQVKILLWGTCNA